MRDEYLLKIHQNVDALKTLIGQPPYINPKKKQDKIRLYLVARAVEHGEAALRIADLETPLFILARVICEDFFLIYWVSASSKHATEYDKGAASQWAKLLRINVLRKRARIIKTETGANVTRKYMPRLEALNFERRIEQIAGESGLLKVYDMVYRYHSLYVHGNTYKFESENPVVALANINAFLKVILFVGDHACATVTRNEVLQSLGVLTIGGE
jgi:hypothetical protein